MDIVRAKPEKDHQELREIIQQYEAAHGFAGEGDPQNSFSFRATEQGFSSWKTNCQLATEDSDCRFGHLKALTVDGALAVRWLFEIDAANASVDAGGGTPAGCCCREGASR
ncbi:hypothetical protein [Rhizobium sp. NFR12]|uniref:hypothetical protein n=1 Tax=Rhizobium sp. NFR12 TaxID=1566261 RepID=UPI001114ADA7|nr:hypothetical protein [Rhizobium sp. NFR12]